MGVVIASTVVFILSTMPELTDDIDIILFNNETSNKVGETLQQNVERWDQVMYCCCLLKTFNIYANF